MLKIDKKNTILDKQIEKVINSGIKKIIFPTGYKHQIIKKYIDKKYKNKNFIVANTGIETTIGQRLKTILKYVDENQNILLLNGDTIINFDLKDFLITHLKSKKKVTISNYNFETNFGLIEIKNKKPVAFKKKIKMETINLKNKSYFVINAGISIINKELLNQINFKNDDFEEKFYNFAMKKNMLNLYKIKNKIYQFDTPKDIHKYKSKVRLA